MIDTAQYSILLEQARRVILAVADTQPSGTDYSVTASVNVEHGHDYNKRQTVRTTLTVTVNETDKVYES